MSNRLLSGCVSHYTMADGDTTQADSVGNNDLTNINGTILRSSAICGFGNSRDYVRAESKRLQAATPVGLDGGGSIMVSAWCRREEEPTLNQTVVGRFTVAGNNRQFILIYFGTAGGTGGYRFGVSSDGADDFGVNDDDTSVGNEIHHVVAWYDQDDESVNIVTNNGTVTSAAGPSSLYVPTAALHVGGGDIGSFGGKLQEIAIWNRPPYTGEIKTLYNGGDGFPFSRWRKGPSKGVPYYYS